MQYTVRLILILLILPNVLLATHNRSGYISCEHLNGLTYRIEVVIYTEINSNNADRPFIGINFNDKSGVDSIPRSIQQPGINGWKNVQRNTYVTEHTFPRPGEYWISVNDKNRIGDIVNIPNSTDVGFNIATQLRVDPNYAGNSSPKILSHPIIHALVNEYSELSFTFQDEEGDVITYELVPPRFTSFFEIPDYTWPSNLDIDATTGILKWTPNQVGSHILSALVLECRNGVILSRSLIDMEVIVVADDKKGSFVTSNFVSPTGNRYIIEAEPGDTIKTTLGYVRDLSTIEYYTSLSLAKFDHKVSNDTASLTLTWIPKAEDVQCGYHTIEFSAFGNIFQEDKVLFIQVRDGQINCSNECALLLGEADNNDIPEILKPYPNPSNGYFFLDYHDQSKTMESLEIRDLSGRIVWTKLLNGTKSIKVDTESISSGLYIITSSFSDRTVAVGKIMIY